MSGHWRRRHRRASVGCVCHRPPGDEDDGAIVGAPHPQACFEIELHENGVAAVYYNCSGEPKRRAGVWAAWKKCCDENKTNESTNSTPPIKAPRERGYEPRGGILTQARAFGGVPPLFLIDR